MLLLLLAGIASAGDAEPVTETPNKGEYHRISQEIEKLSSRNAWSGVVRLWPELLAAGVPLSMHDWVAGANAARAIGDVEACHTRLDEARGVRRR